MFTLSPGSWPFIPGHRFEEEWVRFGPRSAGGIQGCWSGTWKSNGSRKEWPIRCVLTRIAPGTYLASFCTRYLDLLPVSHEIQFHVNEDGREFEMEGSADFGFLFHGVHHLCGHAQPGQMRLSYRSRNDCGEIELKRARAS